MKQVLVLLLFALICAGCSSSQEIAELPTLVSFPTLTETNTATITNTPSDTPTPTPSYTATNTATYTVTASFTPESTHTDVPTVTPSSTITDTPTLAMTNTPINTPTITSSPTIHPTATIASSPLPSGQRYYANNEDVRVRACSRRDCNTLGILQYGDTANVIGETTGDTAFNSNRWYIVNYQGQQGYVHSSLLVTTLPQATSIPSSNNGSGGGGGSTSSRPANCATAVAMGLTDVQAAQWSHLDRDHDGVACYGD